MIAPQRLMLVDDSEADNVFHGLVLQSTGYSGELQVFDCPMAALDAIAAATAPPELVLLDINMPRLDGFAFAERLQALLPRSRWPAVVMLSSSSLAVDRDRALALPIVLDYLTKPLTREQALRLQAGEVGPAASEPAPGGPD